MVISFLPATFDQGSMVVYGLDLKQKGPGTFYNLPLVGHQSSVTNPSDTRKEVDISKGCRDTYVLTEPRRGPYGPYKLLFPSYWFDLEWEREALVELEDHVLEDQGVT
jgi:hypothetical protein